MTSIFSNSSGRLARISYRISIGAGALSDGSVRSATSPNRWLTSLVDDLRDLSAAISIGVESPTSPTPPAQGFGTTHNDHALHAGIDAELNVIHALNALDNDR
jgi:hypothetical protein